ncbi:MAG: hypothetical protein DWQ05_20995 [Calditrichaeota bacterium]|nr:MAG: hypothetical protein DWQ05_20995 [Calditrichota bacterium]
MRDVSLILDIGKSNTRLFLFDENVNIVHETRISIPMLQGDDGFLFDDFESIFNWFLRQLKIIGDDREFCIRALNVCSFGATMAHIDDNGQLIHPIVAYTSKSPEGLDDEFRAWIQTIPGGNIQLGTPVLCQFLNVAKQLYYLRKFKPEIADKVRFSFFLPQYFIYRLTGAIVSEASCYGTHTCLWDFHMMAPSFDILDGLGWLEKMPRLNNPLNLCQLNNEYKKLIRTTKSLTVGPGVHDTAAALSAYWQSMDEEFVLLTTGSWNIALNPFADFSLTEADLASGTRYYLTPHLQRVRASRVFAGREHELQLQRICDHFGVQPVTPEKSLTEYLQKFFANPSCGMLTATAMVGTGPFPNMPKSDWNLDVFDTAEEAYARLCLDLAVLTAFCLENVNHNNVQRYIVDGKFNQNPWFIKILAMLLQPNELYSSNLAEAGATGAAMAIHHFWAPEPEITPQIKFKKIEIDHIAGLRVYAEWLLSYYTDLNG